MFTKTPVLIFIIIKKMLKKLLYLVAPLCLKIILPSIFLTCRWKVYNKTAFVCAQKKSRPVLICSWHNSFLIVARYFKEISMGVWAVSSTHRDSQIMANILSVCKYKLIKGSSTRGWRGVLKKMMALFGDNNNIIAITNDGPKGPPFVAKPGSVVLALKHNVQILAVSGTATKYWTLPSWDQTIIPKPFSTIHIQFADPFDNNIQAGESEGSVVSNYMNANYKFLNKKIHG